MALFEMKFQPGVDKQDTAVGATDRWIDSDNVRWRYNLPEKVGGWSSLLTNTICGVARKQHSFVDAVGNRYVGIGTDKFFLIYFEGALHDITPWRSDNAGAQIKFASSTLPTKLHLLFFLEITEFAGEHGIVSIIIDFSVFLLRMVSSSVSTASLVLN